MNPTLIDILVLFSFVPVWAGLCYLHQRWTDPRARRRRQRKAGKLDKYIGAKDGI